MCLLFHLQNCEMCTFSCQSSSSSLSSRCVPWLSEVLGMTSPSYPVLCCPLPDRVAPVFVKVVSPPLGWSPLSFCLSHDLHSPRSDTRGPSVVFGAVYAPCPGQFHFLTLLIISMTFVLCPDVGLSINVCYVEHTSFQFGLCGRTFVLCLFGQCRLNR